jgi:hypothetical protein
MGTQNQHEEKVWGAKLNASVSHKAADCPAWANWFQREQWRERGLILWDHDTEQIAKLYAAQALEILDYVRTDDHWDQKSIVVGGHAIRMATDHPEQEPRGVFTNEMTLSPTRLCELYELLERSELLLQKMKEEDEAERRRCLSRAYAILLSLDSGQESDEEAVKTESDED